MCEMLKCVDGSSLCNTMRMKIPSWNNVLIWIDGEKQQTKTRCIFPTETYFRHNVNQVKGLFADVENLISKKKEGRRSKVELVKVRIGEAEVTSFP